MVRVASEVQSVLLLRARGGAAAEVVRRYGELGVFEAAARIPGFRSARLLVSSDDPDELLVIAEWVSLDAYDEWLASPIRAEIGSELEPLLDGEPRVSRWVVALESQSA